MKPSRRQRELTGRAVLLWLMAFFAIIFAVNGVLVRAAISTFGGLETQSSYQAGLQFKHELAVVEQQEVLNWHVDGRLTRAATGAAMLDLTVGDAAGTPLPGLRADARLAHPADERLDHVIPVRSVGAGAFHGQATAQAGQWDLIIDLYRGDKRMFRSRSRVTLK